MTPLEEKVEKLSHSESYSMYEKGHTIVFIKNGKIVDFLYKDNDDNSYTRIGGEYEYITTLHNFVMTSRVAEVTNSITVQALEEYRQELLRKRVWSGDCSNIEVIPISYLNPSLINKSN